MDELKQLLDDYRNISFQIGYQKIGPNSNPDKKLNEQKEELKRKISKIKIERKMEEIENDKCKRK